MEPKMITGDAASFLNVTNQAILKKSKIKIYPIKKLVKMYILVFQLQKKFLT